MLDSSNAYKFNDSPDAFMPFIAKPHVKRQSISLLSRPNRLKQNEIGLVSVVLAGACDVVAAPSPPK